MSTFSQTKNTLAGVLYIISALYFSCYAIFLNKAYYLNKTTSQPASVLTLEEFVKPQTVEESFQIPPSQKVPRSIKLAASALLPSKTIIDCQNGTSAEQKHALFQIFCIVLAFVIIYMFGASAWWPKVQKSLIVLLLINIGLHIITRLICLSFYTLDHIPFISVLSTGIEGIFESIKSESHILALTKLLMHGIETFMTILVPVKLASFFTNTILRFTPDSNLLLSIALLHSILLWLINCNLAIAFILASVFIIGFNARIEYRNEREDWFVLIFGLLVAAASITYTFFPLIKSVNITNELVVYSIATMVGAAYFIVPSILFPSDARSTFSRPFYAFYGCTLMYCCLNLWLNANPTSMLESKAEDWLYIILWSSPVFAFALPFILMAIELYSSRYEKEAKTTFYLNHLLCVIFFRIQMLIVDLDTGVNISPMFISIGFIIAAILLSMTLDDVRRHSDNTSASLMEMISLIHTQYLAKFLPGSFLTALIATSICIFFFNHINYSGFKYFFIGVGMQILFFGFFIQLSAIIFLLDVYEALYAFGIYTAGYEAEAVDFYEKVYGKQTVRRELYIKDLLRWQLDTDNPLNILNRMISPVLISSAKGQEIMCNILVSFLGRYQNQINYANIADSSPDQSAMVDQNLGRGQSKFNFENYKTVEEIMNLKIVEICPYLLIDIPLQFYGSQQFRQTILNGSILNYIVGPGSEETEDIIVIENLSSEKIAAKRRSAAGDKYTNGSSAPIVDYYAVYDEQLRYELCRKRVKSILPYNLLGEVRSDSPLFSSQNYTYTDNPAASKMVLYKPRSNKATKFVVTDNDGEITVSRSILQQYLDTINQLAGRAINIQNAFDTLLATGNLVFSMENKERRVDIIYMFGLMVLDADMEVEYTIQSAKRGFLRDLANALSSKIDDIYAVQVGTYEKPGSPVDITKRGSFIFYKSVFEPKTEYSGLDIPLAEKKHILNQNINMFILSTEMGGIYAQGETSQAEKSTIWQVNQLDGIQKMLNNRNLLAAKIKTLYEYGRMFLYLIKARVMPDAFMKNYGRYYIVHKTHKNERGISVNLDAFMQEWSSTAFTCPILVRDNFETISPIELQGFINKYIDLYAAKLIMDAIWHDVYQSTLDQELNFQDCGIPIKDAIMNPRIDLGRTGAREICEDTRLQDINFSSFKVSLRTLPQAMVMYLQMAEISVPNRFITNQYSAFEEKFNYWISQYFSLAFVPALINRTIEILRTQITNLKPELEDGIRELAAQYQSEYIKNLCRFKCLERLNQVLYTPSISLSQAPKTPSKWQANSMQVFMMHKFQNRSQTFSPALLHNLNISENNFSFLVSQAAEWRRPFDLHDWKKYLRDDICFKLKKGERVPANYLENRIHQHFEFTSGHPMLLSFSRNSAMSNHFAGIRSNVNLNPIRESDGRILNWALVPNYNSVINLGFRGNYTDPQLIGSYCKRSERGDDGGLRRTLTTKCSHYTIDSPALTINPIKESCMLNRSVDLNSGHKANLITAATLQEIANLAQNDLVDVPLQGARSRPYHLTGAYYELVCKWGGNGRGDVTRWERESHIIRWEEIGNAELQGNVSNFTKQILSKVAEFATQNASRYERTEIEPFKGMNKKISLRLANLPARAEFYSQGISVSGNRVPDHPPFFLGNCDPFKPYHKITQQELGINRPNYFYENGTGRNRFEWDNAITSEMMDEWLCRNNARHHEQNGNIKNSDDNGHREHWGFGIDRWYRDQRFQPFRFWGSDNIENLQNPQLIGDTTMAMMAMFYASRYPFSSDVRNGNLKNDKKHMDVTFSDKLGFEFRYTLNNPLVKFIKDFDSRFFTPEFTQRNIDWQTNGVQAGIKSPNYSIETHRHLLYVLSREGGLSLNYITHVMNDLQRFDRDLEFSFKRDSEYWIDQDYFAPITYYRKKPGANYRSYNFDTAQNRGEYQPHYAYHALRYQNDIEDLRDNSTSPDCMPVYMAPGEVLNFNTLERACAQYLGRTIQTVISTFEKDPMLFYDKDKFRAIITNWEDTNLAGASIRLSNMSNKLIEVSEVADIFSNDIPTLNR